jgi:hypothetical protein
VQRAAFEAADIDLSQLPTWVGGGFKPEQGALHRFGLQVRHAVRPRCRFALLFTRFTPEPLRESVPSFF